jgi:hypothetical protein
MEDLLPTRVFVHPSQNELTSVQEGATIQAQPPALQMILLPSGNMVPVGQVEIKLDCHQGVGPIIIPIFLTFNSYLYL